MINNDQVEKERVDARNALEEFVYDMRDKLQEDSELAEFVAANDRHKICEELNYIENWLYEDGEDCDRQTYRDKLQSLQNNTDPIKNRCNEFKNFPSTINELCHLIQMARKGVDEYRSGEPKYDHLTETEMITVTEATDRCEKWLDDARIKISQTPKTVDPPVTLRDILNELKTLKNCVNSIFKRPKPTPPPPPPTTNTNNTSNTQNNAESQQNASENNTTEEQSTTTIEDITEQSQANNEVEMDVE